MSSDPNAVSVIKPDQRTRLPGPPGAPFVREQMFADGHVWIGTVITEAGAASPWHHHGAHETYAYVLEGEATVEYGPEGSQRVTVSADGSLVVLPKGLAHREVNTGPKPNRILIVRVGEGPSVIPLEGP